MDAPHFRNNGCCIQNEAQLNDELAGKLRAAFTIQNVRSFDQNPRFGLIVLAEIASRALSPVVNDPGTAIDVIGRLLRVLSHWHPAGQPDCFTGPARQISEKARDRAKTAFVVEVDRQRLAEVLRGLQAAPA